MAGDREKLVEELELLAKQAVHLSTSLTEHHTKLRDAKAQIVTIANSIDEDTAKAQSVEARRAKIRSALVDPGRQPRSAARSIVAEPGIVIDLTIEPNTTQPRRSSTISFNSVRNRASSPALVPSKMGDCIEGKHGAPDMLNAAYPVVVLLNEQWTEIWCHMCGTNINQRGKFFLGIGGLRGHIVKSHTIASGSVKGRLTNEDVAAACHRPILSKEDMAAIRAGNEPKTKIVARTNTTAGKIVDAPGGKARALNDCDMFELKAEESADDQKDHEGGLPVAPESSAVPLLQSDVPGAQDDGARKRAAEDSDHEIDGDPPEGWTLNRPKRARKCTQAQSSGKSAPSCTAELSASIKFSPSGSPDPLQQGEVGAPGT